MSTARAPECKLAKWIIGRTHRDTAITNEIRGEFNCVHTMSKTMNGEMGVVLHSTPWGNYYLDRSIRAR